MITVGALVGRVAPGLGATLERCLSDPRMLTGCGKLEATLGGAPILAEATG